MVKFLKSIIKWASRYVPFTEIDSESTLNKIDELRSHFLYLLILSMMGLGMLAYIPSIYLSIQTGIYVIAIVDTIALFVLYFVGFTKSISTKFKIYLILTTVYLLGLMLMIYLGPMGAGFIWLFFFPVLAAILLDFKAVLICTLILVVTFALLAIPLILKIPGNFHLLVYNQITWLVNVVNFLAVNFTISAAISIIISRLNKTIEKEQHISELMKIQQEQLRIEKNKAQEADRLKSAFLANMSHEIRTPMNGIMGFMDLLKKPELEESKRDHYITIIKKSGDRMLGIINDLVNISKIEANQIDIKFEKTHLNEVVCDTILLYKPICDEKGIDLQCQVNLADNANIIYTDKNKLTQVLANIVHNACKFTKEGFIRVDCWLEGEVYYFCIKDTGIGIREDQKDKIFQRFQYTQHETNSLPEGAGLGLAISKGFIELLKGNIWVESEPAKGTAFYFTLQNALSGFTETNN